MLGDERDRLLLAFARSERNLHVVSARVETERRRQRRATAHDTVDGDLGLRGVDAQLERGRPRKLPNDLRLHLLPALERDVRAAFGQIALECLDRVDPVTTELTRLRSARRHECIT